MTPQDILAAADVLADLEELSDSLSVEEAVAYREAVTDLMTKVKTALGLIDTQLVSILEAPRPINGMLYEVRKSDGKWRPDHARVDAAVKRVSQIDPETGEMFKGGEAVDRCMAIMADLYRSASTMPKVGALDKLGLKKWDVAEQEPGKPVLKVTPIVEAPE